MKKTIHTVFCVERLESRELLSGGSVVTTPVVTTPAIVTRAAATAATPSVDFSSGFSSAAGLLTLSGSANLNGSRLNLTNASPLFQSGAAWVNTKQDITAFSTTFNFQLSNASADGFAFVIQNAGTSSLGTSGGNLGYTGIANSIAIKFDLYNNSGEGSDSTGLFINGAPPLTAGSVDLTGSGIDLHSGHTFTVTIAYANGLLTQTILDTTTLATFTRNYAVSIPTVVGANTAYVGFTGATGGLTATQDITNWTYTPTAQSGLPAPTGVTPTVSPTSISLAWNAVTGATSYNVFRSLLPGGEGATPYATGLATPAYTDTAVIGGTTYYYQVVAVSSAGSGASSAEVSATAAVTLPAAPTNLAATVNSYNQITLNWADNSSNESGFRVEQSKDAGVTWTQITATAANVTTYVVTGLPAATPYSFRVRAFNAAGNSAYTNIAAATTAALATAINYPSGFASATGAFATNGSASLIGSRLNLTNASPLFQAGSAWFNARQDITNFTTTFSFQLTNASADGFAFVLQNASTAGLGLSGGNLGYSGIANSVAIKFDLYNNSGEGSDSTGLFVNGAPPLTGGSIDLTGSGIDLHSGHLFTATVAYTNNVLTQTITDTVTAASWTHNYTINLPTTIGSTTAFAGFTGATGGLTATQDITAWTYSTPLSSQDAQPPTAPTNLSSTATTLTTASIQWTASTDNVGVVGYTIYRSGTKVGSVDGATTSFADSGLAANTSYTYTVTASDASGNVSAVSQGLVVKTLADTQAPTAPSNLSLTASAPTALTIQWTASTDNVGVALYTVYRNGLQIGKSNAATFSDTGLTANTTYVYTVTAADASGNVSLPSAPFSATTPVNDSQAPTAPTNLTLVVTTPTTATIQWTASTDNVAVNGYSIYRNGVQVGIVTAATTTFTNTGLTTNTTYSYTVVATDAAGNASAASTALPVTPASIPPIAGSWNLSFNENFDATPNPATWSNLYWWYGNAGTQATFDPNQISVANGTLNITAVNTPETALNGVTNPYTSGLLSTGGVKNFKQAGFTFTYGYVEARAKIAPGQGMWSALWMLPADYNDNFELDVFENLGRLPMNDQGFLHANGYTFYSGFSNPQPVDLTQAYHTYGVDWEPTYVAWYLDGVEVYRFTGPANIPNRPMYLVLNLDAGGWAGPLDGSSPTQSSWLVDYVRVWQH